MATTTAQKTVSAKYADSAMVIMQHLLIEQADAAKTKKARLQCLKAHGVIYRLRTIIATSVKQSKRKELDTDDVKRYVSEQGGFYNALRSFASFIEDKEVRTEIYEFNLTAFPHSV